MKNSVKEEIKNNFKTMSFEDAIKANEALLPEYIRVYGQRSYNSLKAYYAKHQSEGVAAEAAPQTCAATTDEELLDSIGATTSTEEAPTETADEVKPFLFGNMENFDEEEIKALLATKNPTLKSKCIIIMSFVVRDDGFIERTIRMIVNNDGKGWDTWDDARNYMNDHDIKNVYKKGSFSNSKACFPIGETYIKAWGEWVGYALQNYYLDRMDSDCKVDYVEYAE